MSRRRHLFRPVALVLAAGVACAEGPTDPSEGDGYGDPGPGPHFTVSPIPLDKLARVTPMGHNNKVFPTGHTYWDTCDMGWLMPSGRPCVLEQLPIRAPADGVVFSVEHGTDGSLTIDGPRGLHAGFGHVSPVAGLARGDSVRAGDTIATMTYTHSFDFGVANFGRVPHTFVNPDRLPVTYLHNESPIAQFPESLRGELVARVRTTEDPLGRLSYDVAGTASGGWYLEGTPVAESSNVAYAANHLFLGRLQERASTRIFVTGGPWPGQPNRMVVIDPGEPSWEEITPASGPVALVGWGLGSDGEPNFTFPHGSVLVQVLDGERLRAEWFDTHEPVTAFTSAARIYER